MNTALIGEKEAAKFLGVSRITLLKIRQQGGIAYYRVGKKRVLYSTEHIQDFLNKQEQNRQGD